ncbi:MAG TPA: ParA family protein [Candidatus Limnocylindrales bacterium]
MITLAVLNHKGGSGKTTTAVNLAAALAERVGRVLLVDLDPQASASTWLGIRDDDRGMFDALIGTRDLQPLIRSTRAPGVEAIAASPWLVTAERTLQLDLAIGLNRALRRLPARWPIVLLDCPPSIAFLGVGALTAADAVLVPAEARTLALAGVESVLREVERVQGELNPRLGVAGILVGRMNRTLHAGRVQAELRGTWGDLVLEAPIRETVQLSEAAEACLPITVYAPRSPAAGDFRAAATELVSRLQARPAVPAGPGILRLVRQAFGS